mmetsp:Transcript_28872/g.32963  ORF Transcript_28872/g.32963 Transcript_28872/m.32963 type:complete len:139 (+) Transcript_28872:439-855(+)
MIKNSIKRRKNKKSNKSKSSIWLKQRNLVSNSGVSLIPLLNVKFKRNCSSKSNKSHNAIKPRYLLNFNRPLNNDLILDGENMLENVDKESRANTEPKEKPDSTTSEREFLCGQRTSVRSSLSPLMQKHQLKKQLDFDQ